MKIYDGIRSAWDAAQEADAMRRQLAAIRSGFWLLRTGLFHLFLREKRESSFKPFSTKRSLFSP